MILVIDNYDSFTYNLVQYIGEINPDVKVVRNDQFELDEIENWDPSHIVISPGPGRPENAGHSVEVIKKYGNQIPILGVCLGHQAITTAYGGKVIISSEIVHGKTTMIQHNGLDLFNGLKNPLTATRYHSLVAERDSLPKELKITAEMENGLIMGIEHETHPVYGVQFHPESIATEHGVQIIKNFLEIKP
ncbi:MAG: aminodeoxychorismate/anthranilate synthase component II [Candidatus Marinimicrobia bacterium]|jgi:anthranilate synthase/aminodeoxychorismate synthase-like glutamine amidotransferase|nr:aminodeoxychorismate/anthranilate synthase component II [Candidatus Neomarinimicrobiota bacterium]MBT6711317.1 aminodeoxychorismate/anthranilate synthase component II [Candidatus Neomarinimicrobiota bacterium]